MTHDAYLDQKRQKLAESLGVPADSHVPIILDKPESKTATAWFYIIVGTLFAIFHLCFALTRVSGPSMLPTLKHDDIMLVSKFDKVDRFDIVVLKERITEGGETKTVVKRAIAFGGERVVVVNGKLFVDNQAYEEPYLHEALVSGFGTTSFEITVPKGHIFVLGDNRDVSKDSRMVGSFKKDAVIGVKIN